MAVAVEKLLRARTSRNQIAPGCHINDLLEFRDISGHPISPEEATKKSFSTATPDYANDCISFRLLLPFVTGHPSPQARAMPALSQSL
jgi:hypothetical protein